MGLKFAQGFKVAGQAIFTLVEEILDFLFINEAVTISEDTGLITEGVTSTTDAGTIV